MRMHSEAFAVYLKFLCIWVGIWCLLDVYIDSGLWGEHLWCLQTFDIVNVKGLQTLSMWDTPALWGQCLRTLFDIWVFDLEVYLVAFTTLTLCWHVVIVVSELRLRYYCIWLSFSWEVEQNILLSILVWSSEMSSLCEELIWRWNMRFQWCSVLQERFVKEFEWIISFLGSRVTSLDTW